MLADSTFHWLTTVAGTPATNNAHDKPIIPSPAPKRPRAVFAANDMMAVGCLAAFKDAGVRVPEDIALAGFDDIPIARYVTPALSTVRVRIADFGRLALERLAQVIEHPEQESPSADTLGFEIVTRDTCGGTRPEQDQDQDS